MALPNNPRDQYLRTQVETASKEQLVVMLFDGIIRFTEVARKAIQEKKIEDSHHALMRAQAIVMELICTVDKERGGPVAKNLMGLHAYAFNCLIACNMKKDLSKIDEVQKIYRELREGWVGAMEALGITSTKAAGSPVPPKPLGTAPAPKAPVAAPAPKAAGYPAKGPGGVLAQGRPLAAPGLKPGILGAKPAVPGAPVAPKSAFGLPTMPKPVSAPAAQAPAAQAPAAPEASAAPAAPAPASAISYGMGRTAAMMGAYGKAPAPAQPVVPAIPAVAPSAAAAAAPVPAAVKPAMNAKQAAMLSAYQANSRTSA
jgi:flagellar protein FliS